MEKTILEKEKQGGVGRALSNQAENILLTKNMQAYDTKQCHKQTNAGSMSINAFQKLAQNEVQWTRQGLKKTKWQC